MFTPLPGRDEAAPTKSAPDSVERDIRFFLLFCATLVGLVVVALGGLRIVNDAQREFDSVAWKSSFDPWNRGRMVDDVRSRFIDASRAEIRQELGEGFWGEGGDTRQTIEYVVDDSHFYEFSRGKQILIIEFDSRDRVSDIRLEPFGTSAD